MYGAYLVLRNALNKPRVKVLNFRRKCHEVERSFRQLYASGCWQVGLLFDGLKQQNKTFEQDRKIHRIDKQIRWLTVI